MNILGKVLTLCLNSAWQPIGYKNVQDSICDLYGDNYQALNLTYDQSADGTWDLNTILTMDPVGWNEWTNLPIRDFDFYIRAATQKIRIPTIIVATNFSKMPKNKPKLTKNNIKLRDRGICQYTGKKLKSNQGNVDHVIPISKGGANTWHNMVYCSKEINQKKGDKLPEEIGLSLIKSPKEPIPKPASETIKKPMHRDWMYFLR